MSGATIVVRANFDRKTAGRDEKVDSKPGRRDSRVAHTLALAHHIEKKIGTGALRDYAHVAAVLGVSRPRVTQIMNLLLLAPEIQEAILDLPERSTITERRLRAIVAESQWEAQMRLWRLLGRH